MKVFLYVFAVAAANMTDICDIKFQRPLHHIHLFFLNISMSCDFTFSSFIPSALTGLALGWTLFCFHSRLSSFWHRFNMVLQTFLRDSGPY